jgi:ornithine cyclodeaminase
MKWITAKNLEPDLDWSELVDALAAGHRLPRARIADLTLEQADNTVLNRAAWISGRGIGIKTATIFPGNRSRIPTLPSVHAVFNLFDDTTGEPLAALDGDLVTRWKTVADSMLGIKLLARADARTVTIVGAGRVARTLVTAYRALFPGLQRIQLWNRTTQTARELARSESIDVVEDLSAALAQSDIVSCATLASEPIIRGEWIRPGTHVDLIGAFRPHMREADDRLISTSELFVDARESALHDTGELGIPLATGLISEKDIRGDLYDLCNGAPGRGSQDAVTLYKNAGGAHLDLMTALYMLERVPVEGP